MPRPDSGRRPICADRGPPRAAALTWYGNAYAYGREVRTRSVQPVLGEIVAEGALADAEDLRGILLDPAGPRQRPRDAFALRPCEVVVQPLRRQSERRLLHGRHEPHVAARDHGARTEDHRPLDGILQFTHVARPIVRLERP